MLQDLRTVEYPVGDLTKAMAWYRSALEQGSHFNEPFYVGFNVGGYELGWVLQNTAAGQPGPIGLLGRA